MPTSSRWSDLDRPPLSAARLRRAVADGVTWRDLEVVDTTASTNADLAARARSGEPGGVVLVAEQQTAGRGRLDRRWEAPPRSSLLMSALLRPPTPTPTWLLLPFLAGVAVAEAVRGVAALDARLKWPNDVLVDGRKLGGILVERVETAVVIGIGLNVSLREAELPVPVATSIALAGGVADREVVAKEILRALARRYRSWVDGDGAPGTVLPAYREICATIGRGVRVQLPAGGSMSGRADGVDDSGRLLVVTPDGVTHGLTVGDVVHVRAED